MEGMDAALLRELFEKFTDRHAVLQKKRDPITKADFFADGLTGKEGSTARRNMLCSALSLPQDMTPKALLAAINLLMSREEYQAAVANLPEG